MAITEDEFESTCIRCGAKTSTLYTDGIGDCAGVYETFCQMCGASHDAWPEMHLEMRFPACVFKADGCESLFVSQYLKALDPECAGAIKQCIAMLDVQGTFAAIEGLFLIDIKAKDGRTLGKIERIRAYSYFTGRVIEFIRAVHSARNTFSYVTERSDFNLNTELRRFPLGVTIESEKALNLYEIEKSRMAA